MLNKLVYPKESIPAKKRKWGHIFPFMMKISWMELWYFTSSLLLIKVVLDIYDAYLVF